MKLRDYQTKACLDIAAAWQTHRRVLFTLPTGTGKTEVAAAIVVAVRRSGRRVLWLAHRRELVHQAFTRLLDAGIAENHLGVIMGDDHRARPGAPVQVASVDTIRRRDLVLFDVVIVDEAHHVPAETWAAFLDEQDVGRILGLTATPYRLGRKQLGDHFDVLVQGPPPSELIAAGWMAAPRVFAPSDDVMPVLDEVRVRDGDFNASDLSEAVNKRHIVGGIVEHRQRIAPRLRAVAYAVDIAHAESITSAFVAAGERWETLTGKTPKLERDAMLARLADGALDGIANCAVLTEGWDSPAVKCAILARPTMSMGLYIQQSGRVLRPWGGVAPIILDHAGNALWFNVPHFDRPLSLAMTTAKRGRGVGRALVRSETGELVSVSGELVELGGWSRPPDRCADCLAELTHNPNAWRARRRRPTPWRCGSCATKISGPAKLSPERRAEMERRKSCRTCGVPKNPKGGKNCQRCAAKAQAPEMAERLKQRLATTDMKARATAAIRALSPDQRRARMRPALSKMTHERCVDNGRKSGEARRRKRPPQSAQDAAPSPTGDDR